MLWKNLSLGKAGCDIFSPPSFEEKIFFDDTLPPIYDDYNDSCDSFTPTITNKIDYAYVESNDTFMHVNKNALCDTYIVEFVHDASENHYERGKYGCRNFHVTKTPLYMLKFLKLLVFYLPMLVTLLFMNLFIYKIPFHRKHVRLKIVLNLPLDALFCFNYYFLRVHH